MNENKKTSRYFEIFLGLTVIAVCFFAGLKVGLFLFERTQTTANVSTSTQAAAVIEENYCVPGIKFSDESDKKLCSEKSKIGGAKGLEINLTAGKALLYENEKLISVLPLAYQSQEGKWFQAPTGYYFAGVKNEKHISSIFPVIMPYAFQYYEDFFIHGIPYYENGESVTSNFTGGCLRFAEGIDKQVYDFINPGVPILVYKTFDDLGLKKGFSAPVDLKDFWIRQRFNNPYRNSWIFGGTKHLKFDYYQHTGLDFAPNADLRGLNVDSRGLNAFAIYDGKIAKIQLNDGNDHGLGNTIIIEHSINGEKLYSLYAHLSLIETNLKEGDIINKGEIIGQVGNSGYGCENYWRIGKDGCNETGKRDTHLHFELKKAPVLENPEGGDACQTPIGDWRFCYGYTPDYPQDYGYYDPTAFLFTKLFQN